MTEPNRPERPRMPPQARAASPMRSALLVLALALAGFLAWRFWAPQATDAPPASTASAPAQEPSASAPAPGAASDGQAPDAPLHPVAPAAEQDAAGDAAARLEQALSGLLGGPAMRALLPDRLALRVVATVDNLGRSHAPARMWPVAPTPGRFQVREREDGTTIVAADNDARYAPFVSMAESVDPARLAALYARFYPLFQDAYAEIGFPGRHFNDRLVEVIDHLLATPRPALPLRVRLVEVRSETPTTRPWVRYEFADPTLERLSAGQKLMLRVGPENRRRLEAVLAGLRRQVADGALGTAR
ncbi:DUF3014 domain-containing protein [Quisquiliibacterium transsilvanicum]|uniref:DUF3014 domain-containing protein n=1 Tax=Quisquiliibacterium transsilvanicum TaxID=1549638 RepID=A0A7W8M986_9BURK|nr:DUF3014 domain-containing protein [Quisquiliibacterium transsilvanicum]MBB5272608.1 hypothetical protein [Quisquiliibacterium transsilvanicum]